MKYIYTLIFFCSFLHAEAQIFSKVRLSGNVQNIDFSSNPIQKIDGSYYDVATGETIHITSPIQEDGSFNVEIQVPKTLERKFYSIDVIIDSVNFTCIVGDQQEVYVSFDKNNYEKTMLFKGAYEKVNNDYFQMKSYGRLFEIALLKDRVNFEVKSPEDYERFLQSRLSYLKQYLEFYTDYQNKHKTDSLAFKMLKLNIKYSTAAELMIKGNISGFNRNSYQKVLDLFPINELSYLMSDMYVYYLEQIFSAHHFGSDGVLDLSANDLLSYIHFKKIVLDSSSEALLKRYEGVSNWQNLSEIDSLQLKKMFSKYPGMAQNTGISILFQQNFNNFSGGIKELFLTWLLNRFLKANLQPDEYVLDSYKRYVKDDYLRERMIELVQEENNLLTGAHLSLEIDLLERDSLPADSTFQNLIAPYKGKVVYVIFWGTWCGPCIDEIPHTNALYSSLKGEPVVFLYLGVSSPVDSWKKVIAKLNIAGRHYNLNDEEYKYLKKKFEINGVPRHMLIDQNGNIVQLHAPGASEEGVKEQIKKLF